MFSKIFRFEFKSWFKVPLFYVYSSILFLFSLFVALAAAGAFDLFTGTTVSATYVNSTISITGILSEFNIILYFMLPSIIGASINKDFKYNVHHILFAYPFKKASYLGAKFLSSFLIVLIIIGFIYLGLLLGTSLPFTNPKLLAEFDYYNYLQPFLLIVLPNLIFIGAVVFAVVTFSRNIFAGFITVLVFIVLQSFTSVAFGIEEYKILAAYLDPLGFGAINLDTEYWTIFEQNNNYLPTDGYLLYNRLIWMLVSIAIFTFVYVKFKFNQQPIRLRWSKAEGKKVIKSNFNYLINLKIPKVDKDYSFRSLFRFSIQHSFFDFKYILTNKIFIGFTLFIILIALPTLIIRNPLQGTTTYPVTREMAQLTVGITSAFMVIMTFLFSGLLINRAKISKMNHLVNATAFPNWTFTFSKFLAMFWVQSFLFLLLIFIAVLVQLFQGYFLLELDHYLFRAFVISYPSILVWTMLSFFTHQILKNYVVGFVVLLAFLILLGFFPDLGIQQSIFRFNNGTGVGYSDMTGWSDSIKEFLVYRLYWLCLGVVLYVLSLQFYRRVELFTAKQRIAKAFTKVYTPRLAIMLVGVIGFLSLGSWIYYNDNVLNKRYTGIELEEQRVNYEKTYRKYLITSHPRITDVFIDMDLYPKERNINVEGKFKLENKTSTPIDSILINVNDYVEDYTISKEGSVTLKDTFYNLEVYHFKDQLMPGEAFDFTFKMQNEENTILNRNSPVRSNGTFFNSSIFPSFGYAEGRELSNYKLREKYELPPKERMKSPYDSTALGNTYISKDADWINFEAKVSTSEDQIAIVPGYLVEEKVENGRREFHYKMDKPMLNFYNFVSARYEVYEEMYKGVNIQIFYHKPHDFNIERMVKSSKASLDYYQDNYSPYQFRQLRIMEFPSTAGTFAQSFANTVPFSEAIGFIAKVDEDDDSSVDYPYSVTAHEIAHQWWAHQVIGANVRGATMLSESLAEYSCLKVLEQQYGQGQMRRFLKEALDDYLEGRGREQQKELPLMFNENQQYIHYNKGSLVMYAMSDYLGEKKFNNILKDYLEDVAFQQPPYTTSLEFVSHLENRTPDSLKYLIEDMYKSITLYDNYVENTSYTVNADSTYTVNIEAIISKYKTDIKGKKLYALDNDSLTRVVEKDTLKSWPLNDYVEIGIFTDKEVDGKMTKSPIYLEKVKVDQIYNLYTITVDEMPAEVGIDPYNKLIDKRSSDNRKAVNQ